LRAHILGAVWETDHRTRFSFTVHTSPSSFFTESYLPMIEPRPQAIVIPPLLHSPSSTAKHKRSSSSEHSSIEKLGEGQSGTRSRRQTSSRPERTKRNGQKSGSELSESPDDWRMVNYTFQEVTHYPVLIQINQQMQMLSRQLYEIESTNSLQLKIIAQLLNKLIKASTSSIIFHLKSKRVS
ncbi:hypothetical protein ANCDUO_26390, partial [Ancylostoma duodenale]